MKKLSLNIKKIALSLLVAGLAVGFSAFKAESNKLADGDYRFYNRNGLANQAAANYVFRSNSTLCATPGNICSEVFNIGTQTAPTDGKELSSYAIAPTHVGDPNAGDYTGL